MANSKYSEEMLLFLKSKLSKSEYYVFFYLHVAEPALTRTELANLFKTTENAIKQIEIHALTNIKKHSKSMDEIDNNPVKNTNPLDIDDVTMFMFLKKALSKEEQQMYQLLYLSNQSYSQIELASIMNIDASILKDIYLALNKKRQIAISSDKYQEFKNRVIQIYKTALLDTNNIGNLSISDFHYLKDKYLSLSLTELLEYIASLDIKLRARTKRKLAKIYNRKSKMQKIDNETLERNLNIAILGYEGKDTNVAKNKLYPIYLEHKDEFLEKDQLYIECFFFKTRPKEDFTYPVDREYLFAYAIFRLEEIYFGLNIKPFDRDKYIQVRKQHYDKFTKERIMILDLFYGINTKAHDISEIAEIMHLDYNTAHDILFDAIDQAKVVYTGQDQGLDIDYNLYIPYVKNNYCSFLPDTYKIMRYFLIDNMSYDEISKITGLSKTRISNIITDAIRLIDYYRFNITEHLEVSSSLIEEIFKNYPKSFDELDKQIIRLKYVDYLDNVTIAKKLKIEKSYVRVVIQRFNLDHQLYQTKDIEITKEDYLEEYYRHPSESILNEVERKVIKLRIIDNLSNEVTANLMNLNNARAWHILYDAQNKIKARKIGLIRPDLSLIPRSELEELLRDKHLPISEKEREIINYLFGLNGYPYKTLKELPAIFDNGANSIRRRYYRAIVSIKKYQVGEIKGSINYELDIVPILKYFPTFKRNIVIDHYKNKMTLQGLSKKYNMSFNVIDNLLVEIKYTVYCLLNNAPIKKFDFEYYEQVKNNPDVPYYGDKDLAIMMFDLYYGMNGDKNMVIPSIIKENNLSLTSSTASHIIGGLMLAICKYKMGIRKEKEIDYEKVREYNQNHSHEFSHDKRYIYKRFLASPHRYIKLRNTTNRIIIGDYLKEYDPNYIELSKLTKEDVIHLIQRYGDVISHEIKQELMQVFNVTDEDIKNNHIDNELYELLDLLDLKLLLSEQSIDRNPNHRLIRELEHL